MTRVAVFSDIHFGQMARTSFFAAPGEKIKDDSRWDVPLGEGLIELMKSMKPEYLFIAGDLTSKAEPQEFYYCENKILEIADEVGVDKSKIICCTGNHDIDWQISYLSSLTEERTKDFENVSEILKHREEKYQVIASNVLQLSMNNIQFANDGIVPCSGIREAEDFVLFILNSSLNCGPRQSYDHGELTKKQLDWFEEQLKEFVSDKRKKIVLMHHHPIDYPFPTVCEDISKIREGADFVAIASQYKVDFVIHGHRHHPIVKTGLLSGGTPITYFCAGSLAVCCEQRSNGEIPNTVHFIDIDKSKDYFVLHNYSYSGNEGWIKTHYTKATPIDDVMKVGKVFSEDNKRRALGSFKSRLDKYIVLDWHSLDESLQFSTYSKVMQLMREELNDIYHISGEFPEKVYLIRKEACN